MYSGTFLTNHATFIKANFLLQNTDQEQLCSIKIWLLFINFITENQGMVQTSCIDKFTSLLKQALPPKYTKLLAVVMVVVVVVVTVHN
jgi:hypothetical protein